MIGEDSPGVGLRMVAERAFRSLCCKAKGRRSEGLLINCPEPVPCQSRRWVTVMKSKSRVTIPSAFLLQLQTTHFTCRQIFKSIVHFEFYKYQFFLNCVLKATHLRSKSNYLFTYRSQLFSMENEGNGNLVKFVTSACKLSRLLVAAAVYTALHQ